MTNIRVEWAIDIDPVSEGLINQLREVCREARQIMTDPAHRPCFICILEDGTRYEVDCFEADIHGNPHIQELL